MSKNNNIIKIFFLIIGLIVFVVGVFSVIRNISFLKNSTKADGVVTEMITRSSRNNDTNRIEYTYSPKVSFTDGNGQNIVFISDSSSNNIIPSFSVGAKVSVLYNKDNSQEAKINTPMQLWGGEVISTFIGLVFFLIGLFSLISKIKKNKMKNYLISNGTKIIAKVTSVEKINSNSNSNMNVPNRISVYIMNYKIVAQWLNPSDNQIYIYESDTIDYDPSDYVLGKDIEVYIDNLDPKKYYMNIDTLPKIAN